MTQSIDLRVLELLAARLCHDLISPVSAIANGVELMGEDDPDFVRQATELVGDSARTANRRLQFYRFAFGFSGGGLTGPAPHALAAEFFAESGIACEYDAAVRQLPIDQQQLACLMLLLGADGLPRGGQLSLLAGSEGPQVDAAGQNAGLSPEAQTALALRSTAADLTTRTVGAYFAGLLADAQGKRLALAERAGGFRLSVAD